MSKECMMALELLHIWHHHLPLSDLPTWHCNLRQWLKCTSLKIVPHALPVLKGVLLLVHDYVEVCESVDTGEWAVVLEMVLRQVRIQGWRKFLDDSMLVLLADVTCTLADTIHAFTQDHIIPSNLLQGLLKQLLYLME